MNMVHPQQSARDKKKSRKIIIFCMVMFTVFYYQISTMNNILVLSGANLSLGETETTKPPKIKAQSTTKEFSGTSSRKWKHIRTVNGDTAKISFQLHNPSIHPIKHVYNQYGKCKLGELTKGKAKGSKLTGEVRTGQVPDDLMQTK